MKKLKFINFGLANYIETEPITNKHFHYNYNSSLGFMFVVANHRAGKNDQRGTKNIVINTVFSSISCYSKIYYNFIV